MTLLLIILLPLVGALLPPWFVRWGRTQSALAAGGAAGAAFLLLASLAPEVWAGGTPRLDLPWMPAIGLEISLRLDGLGLLFSLLILGIGLLVILYARIPWDASTRSSSSSWPPCWGWSWPTT